MSLAAASIVVVSSIADHYIAPEQDIGYHVSKAGLVQLARYYALKLGPMGVRVNAVSPCVVIKDAAKDYYNENSWLTDRFERLIPLGRAGRSDDIVNAIMFLTSKQASYITGQNNSRRRRPDFAQSRVDHQRLSKACVAKSRQVRILNPMIHLAGFA